MRRVGAAAMLMIGPALAAAGAQVIDAKVDWSLAPYADTAHAVRLGDAAGTSSNWTSHRR